MGKVFHNFRRPVVYILEQELRKRDLRRKVKLEGDEEESEIGYPIKLIRDDVTKKVIRCEYGTGSEMYSEDIIRDFDNKVVQVKENYPEGESDTLQIVRGENGRVTQIDKI